MSQPQTTLDRRYSSDRATATPWETARDALAGAEIYWVTTVRPDGRPHSTPLIAVWLDDALTSPPAPRSARPATWRTTATSC